MNEMKNKNEKRKENCLNETKKKQNKEVTKNRKKNKNPQKKQ